jgi:hypothetical protein
MLARPYLPSGLHRERGEPVTALMDRGRVDL